MPENEFSARYVQAMDVAHDLEGKLTLTEVRHNVLYGSDSDAEISNLALQNNFHFKSTLLNDSKLALEFVGRWVRVHEQAPDLAQN